MNNFVKAIESFISSGIYSKETIIDIVKLQDSILKKMTGIGYINLEDIKSIRKFNKDDVKKFISSLKDSLEDEDTNDATLSPWCTVYSCKECPYGKEHGICSKDGSTSRKISNVLDTKHRIDEIVEIEEILEGIAKILNIKL